MRIATGSRSVRTVWLPLLTTWTDVHSPSSNGSEINSKCSPYMVMWVEALNPSSLILEQFSTADRLLACVLRAFVGAGVRSMGPWILGKINLTSLSRVGQKRNNFSWAGLLRGPERERRSARLASWSLKPFDDNWS